MRKKEWADNLAHARAREELDYLKNSKKEYRTVIRGLSSQQSSPPAAGPERTAWIKDIVTRLAEAMAPGAGEKVLFIRKIAGDDRELPAAEVVFDNAETAKRVRRGFVEKRKAGIDFGKIYMANRVTLATRVRVALMQAMARQFGSEQQKMFVKQYSELHCFILL